MEWILNPDGSRNRAYRPYIDQEETNRNSMLWDPSRPLHYGLYDRTQPPVYPWKAAFHAFKPPGPLSTIVGDVRVIPKGAPPGVALQWRPGPPGADLAVQRAPYLFPYPSGTQ